MNLTRGRTRGGDATPNKVFLKFLLDKLLSRPAVFSSLVHIPKTHFDIRLVRIGGYTYEI